MQEKRVTNWQELLEAEIAAKAFAQGRWPDGPAPVVWYRGQAKASWPLLPGVYRDLEDPTREYPKVTYPRDHEVKMVQEFKKNAPPDLHRLLMSDEEPQWLFLMQHCRLPTRLLDWTESIMVAAFFAIRDRDRYRNDQQSEAAAIWVLNPIGLNANFTKPLGTIPTLEKCNDSVWVPLAPAFDRQAEADRQYIVAAKPPEVNEKIKPQAPCVTIHALPGAVDHFSPWNWDFCKFVIPFHCQDALAAELAAHGVTRESVAFDDAKDFGVEIAHRHRAQVLAAKGGMPY